MRKLYIILSLVLALVLVSCKDYNYKGNPHLIITIADAPSTDFTSLTTSVEQVELYNGTDWVELDTNPEVFDLMTLTGKNNVTLVDEDIPEGVYSKIRVTFSNDNYLKVFGELSGYQMRSEPGDLVWTEDIDLVALYDEIQVAEIDVDLNMSVTYDEPNDEYYFKPSSGSRIVDSQLCGAVFAVLVNDYETVITQVVQVNVIEDGQVLFSTYSNAQSGRFFFRVPGGIYNIELLPQYSELYQTKILEDVVVEDGKAISLGKVILDYKLED